MWLASCDPRATPFRLNAAHAFSLAAQRFHGYRSESRFLVFRSLQHTLQLSPARWRVLDQAHKKRNLVEYEGSVDVDIGLLTL